MDASPLLTEEDVAFITSEVSISIASRDARKVPSLCKVVGCRVGDDRRRITVLVEGPPNPRLLADVQGTGAVAVVFTLPRTHETMQLKGFDAFIDDVREVDGTLATEHSRAFAEHLVQFGYPHGFSHAVHACRHSDLAAITFTVSDVFAQTPGAGAGERMDR